MVININIMFSFMVIKFLDVVFGVVFGEVLVFNLGVYV